MNVKLYIGNKNYSSWSLRPWLCLKKAGIAFEEEIIPLDVPGFKEKILSVSSAGTVPILVVDGVVITESLAIAEWAAEQDPSLWPKDALTRAEARAAASLMHAGFSSLREYCPMNIRAKSSAAANDAALADARKIEAFWTGWLNKYATDEKPFLFGEWSIADAFYAPVVARFETYHLPRSPLAQKYINAMKAEEAFSAWSVAAQAESWSIEETDKYLS
ncbi:glutathione S-transferase family protein [Hirschia baltica]|uniref:Glutathione S-transferase domain protein n=1 Tax=Hirschia baltica (strain ATCC 49814 / DSM 5838 / IFAM 1418) TaxID=582402 RepID=C6XPF7_HIRBI|nr:glutathione S-transferase family protein [Hirschia baltica]ACT58443.1 Glutathione S-transferase domain protein [Hirschia baltica ATCC 49814]